MTYSIYNNTMASSTINTVTITGPTPTYTTGSAGTVLTTNGSGSLSWDTVAVDPSLQGNTLKVNGDATITGELTVQGVTLSARLDKIEERLGILRPNEELEAKWENLRGLRKAYLELEAEIIEKEKMWAILNR